MTRAQIRRICAEGAKYFIEDPVLFDRGACVFLERIASYDLALVFQRYLSPDVNSIVPAYWLREFDEDHWHPSCRHRRAMALLLFAEAVDLKELK